MILKKQAHLSTSVASCPKLSPDRNMSKNGVLWSHPNGQGGTHYDKD